MPRLDIDGTGWNEPLLHRGQAEPMIRLFIFLTGLGLFLFGAASHTQWVRLPFDCRSIECSIGSAVFSLDVVLMIVGVFLILIAWVFHRLAQE